VAKSINPAALEAESPTAIRKLSVHADFAERDKLVALGQLAAGVAHEVNNPAAYVLTNLEHLRRLIDDHAEDLESAGLGVVALEMARILEDSLEGMHRIREVVSDLRLFSRGADDAIETVDINAIVRAVVNMASSEIKTRARVELEIGEVRPMSGNRGRLTQVLLNLVLNAAQACDEGDRDTNVVRIATREHNGSVCITVSDTGCGIPQQVRAHIFEPFFTTKPANQGTGLGLAVSREVVRRLGGTLSYKSREHVGSTFSVTLPLREPPPHEQHTSAHSGVNAPARPRVLLIDDEPGIRRALLRALRRSCDVTAATAADEALELLRSGMRFDVIVSDLLLPGMTGMEFYALIARELPDLTRRVLFVTGGAVTERARQFMVEHAATILSKPVDTRRLEAIIDAVSAGASVRDAVELSDPTPL
jgi:nitrogen-specific signal transduction histidine kinase/CheY-like chemotaxis protein